jgi:hypothetical protein
MTSKLRGPNSPSEWGREDKKCAMWRQNYYLRETKRANARQISRPDDAT